MLTKLLIPAGRTRLIHRARLVGLFEREPRGHLILVCAPAGYGKTTLLAEWAQSQVGKGVCVAWYALDPGDDTPSSFSAYLVAGMIQALGPVPELVQTAELLRSSFEMDVQGIMTAVINAVISCGKECALVLDDYHLISVPAIHSAVAYLIEHAPDNLRVAIGSRSDPPFPLARLRARGQLLEVRASDLRFTADESARFLNEVMRLDLAPEQVSALDERTEGWVAGLQLAALSLANRADKEELIRSFSGSHRYLVDYLLEEVFNRQSGQIQSFLLATSVLERFCAPLCDGLLGGAGADKAINSEAILSELDQANLFLVGLDDQGYWFRYHHLFRDFLRARLAKLTPQDIPLLHRAACAWLAANGMVREAVDHAFRTRDWEFAAEFVEEHSFTLIIHSDITTIYEWCSHFPEAVMQVHPMLCLQQSLALAYGFRRQNRDKVISRLKQVECLIGGPEDPLDTRGLADLSGVVRTFLAMAPDPTEDPHEILTLARQMVETYPENDPGQFSGVLLTGYAYLGLHVLDAAEHAFEKARRIALREGLFFGVVESTFHMARLAHSRGQLHRAAEICRQGQTDISVIFSNPNQELPALGCLDVELGCLALELNQLGEAEEHLNRGMALMGGRMNLHYLMAGYLGLFRLRQAQNRYAEATKYLDQLEAVWPDLSFLTRGLRIHNSTRSAVKDENFLTDAAEWSRGFMATIDPDTFSPGLGPIGATEAYFLAYLTWARVQAALGTAQEILPSVNRLLDRAQADGLDSRVIELSLLQAQAYRAMGNDPRSREALELALDTAESDSFVRIFDQGSGLVQMLSDAARQGIRVRTIQKILTAIGVSESISQAGLEGRPRQTCFGETISDRELEILGLITQGATNQEIADRLVITVGTVKSHINHILGKLDAHNRTEAVARARGLGLLTI